MGYNIIEIYTSFIYKKLLEFFKMVLKNDYTKKNCEPFIKRYIDVRYYNETEYTKEKEFIKRLNKELLDVYQDLVTEDNVSILRNIVALFGYITYFDDIYDIVLDMEVIHTLVTDDALKINHEEQLEKDLRKWYAELKKGKSKLENVVLSKEFCLSEKTVYRKTYEVSLDHNVKVSNLYSEYAVNKSYNSGVVQEDKLFIMAIMSTWEVLNSAIHLDFSKKYIITLPSSVLGKHSKWNRLMQIINSPLAKKFISFKINYSDYKAHENQVKDYMKNGFSFSVLVDKDTITKNELILFSYVFVYEESEIFDIILDSKKSGVKVIVI